MAGGKTAFNLVYILGNQSRDFLVGHNGDQVKISDLKGKTVGLYFSGSWCPPSVGFTQMLVEVYAELASMGEQFEVVYISGDLDKESFNEYFAKMPWLAVPFSDVKTRSSLNDLFKVRHIPFLVVLNKRGVVTNEDAVSALREYGSEAYPFTHKRIKELEAEKEMTKSWPKTVKHPLHKRHELVLTGDRMYICNGCEDRGQGWSLHCQECDFDLHPKCVFRGC